MTSYKAGGVNKRIIALFDVDGTLTAPRKVVTPDMHAYLMSLKERITIGVDEPQTIPVGHSTISPNTKIHSQLSLPSV